MAQTGRNSDIFTNEYSNGNGDIHDGIEDEYVTDIEKNLSLIESPLQKKEDDGHASLVEQWGGSLEMILEDVPQFMCCPGHPGRISRIPEYLRHIDVKSYEPIFLSLGPYHHGRPQTQEMEKRKWMLMRFVLETRPELKLTDYLREIKSTEQAARSFYSDVEMDSETFVRMLVLDSLYIVTMFCGMAIGQEKEDDLNEGIEGGDDQDSMPRWFWTLFPHDLFLLENQLPFFVLEKIYALTYGDPKPRLIDALKGNIGKMLSNYTSIDSNLVISSTDDVHHMLHLSHMFFRPTLQQESQAGQFHSSSEMFRLGSAMQLYEAGVNFEARSCSAQYCLLDITFRSGKIVMPFLHVDDNTVSLLRNIVALEQMKYPSMGFHVSAYVVLLLHLITTPEDVLLLRRKGIIQHHLSSDKEMMYVINRLSLGLAFDYVGDNYSLKPLFQGLKGYTERRVPQWKAWLKHRYFNNPWMALSLLAATLLLLLTALQTYCSVYCYYYPCFKGQ